MIIRNAIFQGAVKNFVSNGVVVVTIQYRLGPFGELQIETMEKIQISNYLGFFTTFTPEFPPNRGMYDQIMALRWVREEISAFGGDPDRFPSHFSFMENGSFNIQNNAIRRECRGHVRICSLVDALCSRSNWILVIWWMSLAGLFHRIILESGAANAVFRQPNDVRGTMERQRAAQVSIYTTKNRLTII